MIIRVDNTPRDYAWGTTSDIATLRGKEPSGNPEAELWLGTHPGSPLYVTDDNHPEQVSLGDFLTERGCEDLPYLLKLLSAASPLSIQVHPTKAQAQAGFDRENTAGIALDAPHRNYKDAMDKPELIVALEDGFVALSGFQSPSLIRAHLERLREVLVISSQPAPHVEQFISECDRRAEGFLGWALEWILSSPDSGALLDEVVRASELVHDELILSIAELYPQDRGVLVAMLLHRVTLRRGEALYLPAGNVHAYIRGFGIELMAASDNVLRGGLTPKHIDVPELLNVADVTPVDVPHLHPEVAGVGVHIYHPEKSELTLACVNTFQAGRSDPVQLRHTSIAICTQGSVTLHGKNTECALTQGDIVAILTDEECVYVTGSGELFLAL